MVARCYALTNQQQSFLVHHPTLVPGEFLTKGWLLRQIAQKQPTWSVTSAVVGGVFFSRTSSVLAEFFWYDCRMATVKLSVIVPVYNEEKTVATVLKKLVAVKDVAEIVVVDDGSQDKSGEIIKKLKLKKVQYFRKENGGKGSAIRYGLDKVTGNYTLIQDADLEYDPADIPLLLEPVRRDRAHIIYGSRFLGPHLNLLFWHRVGNHVLNLLVNILYNTTLSDMETCYKLIPTELFRKINLHSNNFDIEPEITCKLLRRGHWIYEVPISYVGRTFAEGKKITWKDGISAVFIILRLRF